MPPRARVCPLIFRILSAKFSYTKRFCIVSLEYPSHRISGLLPPFNRAVLNLCFFIPYGDVRFSRKTRWLGPLENVLPQLPDHIPFTNYHLAHETRVLASRILYFHFNLTEEEVADQLGIGQTTVA